MMVSDLENLGLANFLEGKVAESLTGFLSYYPMSAFLQHLIQGYGRPTIYL